MGNPKKLLSIGHSYVVTLNRRLVNEMAKIGGDEWEITVVAPRYVKGDLRPIHLETDEHDICKFRSLPLYLSQKPHIMFYGCELREILQQEWDLIHCWQEPYTLVAAQVAYWKLKTTPILYATFQNQSKNYPLPFNVIEKYVMKNSSGWIAFAQTVFQELKSRPGYSSPRTVISPGVDVKHFQPSEEVKHRIKAELCWHSHEDTAVVGYLGRLVPEKGLHLLMKVMEQISVSWKLLIVGTGPMEVELRRWAAKYPDQVRVCTDVGHSDVPDYLNAMDILVAPSQTYPNWREQFGRMLIEAFACSVPVIGSDCGEIPYVLEGAGIVVGEKDEQGWVMAITQLLQDPALREKLGRAGLEKARRLYSWSAVAQQHLDFFKQILSARVSAK